MPSCPLARIAVWVYANNLLLQKYGIFVLMPKGRNWPARSKDQPRSRLGIGELLVNLREQRNGVEGEP
jgi:hypothetical protein